jgi:hypothetical protein
MKCDWLRENTIKREEKCYKEEGIKKKKNNSSTIIYPGEGGEREREREVALKRVSVGRQSGGK